MRCNVFPNEPPLLLSERNGFPILLPLNGQTQEGGMVGKGRNWKPELCFTKCLHFFEEMHAPRCGRTC